MRNRVRRTGVVYPKLLSNEGVYSNLVRPMVKALGLVSLVAAVGCGMEFSSQKEKTRSTDGKGVTDEKVNEEKSAGATFKLSAEEIYRYQALVEWQKRPELVSIYIDDNFAFRAESPEINSYALGLDHNRQYKISLYAQKSATSEKTSFAEWTIQTPLDVLLTNTEVDQQFAGQAKIELQANRVFVPSSENSSPSFISNGREILISTNELIADQSLIATFPKDQKAANNQPGRNGGLIVIKAKTARGKLSFELRGENGGDGVNGEPYAERAPSGANGTTAIYRCTSFDSAPDTCQCVDDSWSNENGKRGAKGLPGRNGTDGGRGGNSGSLKIEVSENSPYFHISINNELGLSGNPGLAGPPQLGGLSGKKLSDKERMEKEGYGKEFVCKKPIEEGDGDPGDLGRDGVKKPNGTVEQNCISIGEGFGRCS